MVDSRQLQVLLDIRAKNESAGVVKKMEADLAAVGKTATTVSSRLASISRDAKLDRIGEQFGKMAIKIKDTDKAAAALEKRLKSIGATDKEVQRATDAFASTANAPQGRQRIAAGVGAAALNIRNQAAIQTPLGISTDAIAKIVALFANLPPVALPVIGVLAALGAGFVALEVSLQGVGKALTDAVNVNKTYYELIGDNVSVEDAKKRLEELKTSLKAQQEELANINRANAEGFSAAAKEYTKGGATILTAIGTLSSADDKLAERHTELTNSTKAAETEIEGITRALDNNVLVSAEYQKALEAERKIKADAAIGGAADVYNRELKKQQDSLLTSAQLFSKVTTAIQEQNAAQAALSELRARKAGGATGEEIDKEILRLELQVAQAGKNIGDYYALIANKRPIEDAIQNEKDLAAARLEVDKINDSVNKAVADKTADLIAIQEKYKLSLDELKTAFDRAGLEAEIERQQKIADLGTDLREKETEEATKFNDDRVKIESDYQKRVKEIQREFTRSSAQAIQDRDAVALDAAERKRTEELEEAVTTRDEQLKEREIQYKAELRGLRNNHAQRINEINLSFQREAEQRMRKYNYDLQALAAQNQRDIALRQSAFSAQLAELRKNLLANNAEWAAAGRAIVNYAKSVKDSINNILGGGNSGVANGAITPSPTNPIDLGGIFGGGGSRSFSSSGGTGLRAPQAAGAMGAGVSVVLQGIGMSKSQVKREIDTQIDKIWIEAGF
jgi:DNA-binding protein